MGLFTQEAKTDYSVPLFARLAAKNKQSQRQFTDQYLDPFIKENIGYESPRMKMKSIAQGVDLSDGKAVQKAYMEIQAINPQEAQGWLESIKPVIALQLESLKLKSKTIKGADGYNYYLDTGERVLKDVVKAPNKDEAPITAADRIIFNNFVSKHGKLKGAEAFADYKQSLKISEAQAGTEIGSIKPKDITAMMSRWDTETGKIEDSIATIDNAKDLLNEAIAGNATAYEQVNRFLIKVVGDSQISNLEVQNMVNAGSLPERLSQTLKMWASGTPTDTKAEDIKTILDALNENSKLRVNEKRKRYKDSYGGTYLPTQTIDTVFGSDYQLGPTASNATQDEIDAAIAAKSGGK